LKNEEEQFIYVIQIDEDRRVTKDYILFLFLCIYINKRFTDRALALYRKENKRNTCLFVFAIFL
jgi:hypothetical protein